MKTPLLLSILLPGFLCTFTSAADWPRFRGPNGSGIAPDDKPVPTEWSEEKNLKWKTPLPGPGSSSPVVTGDRVFVTCWTGYATDEENRGGDPSNLKRHLICLDRKTGKILWDQAVAAKLPEDRYGGMFAQHGYASHTPVTDGTRVYAFFGKSGVYAYDLDGKPLWQADVGIELDRRNWGSASSPILVDGYLIVTAAPESHAMYAFDAKTGKQVWKAGADGFESTWGTPVVATAGQQSDIVLSVPGEIWGLNPQNGQLRWYSTGLRSDSVCNSAIVDNGIIYAMADRGGGSLAVRAGGKDDVSKSNIAWTGANGSRIPTPVLWDGRLYWTSGSLANCRDARTGQEVYSERLPGATELAAESNGVDRGGRTDAGERGGFGGGGRGPGGGGRRGGGMGGAMMGQDYASPVAANGHLFQVTRRGEVLVIKLGPKFELMGRNKFASDHSDFSATPAISDGQLFIRSAKALYCVGE
jgi:outer membrane protein assembly factor BamB